MINEVELQDLVAQAVGGDRKALRAILSAIHPAVVRYCRLRMGNERSVSPEDVAQEVLLAVARALPRYVDHGRPFMAFVYGVASHKVADAHRANMRDLSQPEMDLPDRPFEGEGPESITLDHDSCNEVGLLLDRLSEKARNIIVLRVFEGLSAEETADRLGMTPGAVRVAQHRALTRLRGLVEQAAVGSREYRSAGDVAL
ncbi:sigma-70 family RNA polymerase sigma factor [Corynebacterium sp. H113]|uniref:sigma-70 family RNA polymerase sigma factor n=1 Tax=Corynebacterium sp. H113 TaxID=3133419 RepID=UPI0030A63E55